VSPVDVGGDQPLVSRQAGRDADFLRGEIDVGEVTFL
jgi:hypothetical protein